MSGSSWGFLAGFFLSATLFGIYRAAKLAGQERQRERPQGKIVSPMWWQHQAADTISASTAKPLQLRKPGMQDSNRRANPFPRERSSPDHARQRRPATKSSPASSGPSFTRKSPAGASSARDLSRKSSPRPASAKRSSCPEALRSWGSLASSSASSSSRNSRVREYPAQRQCYEHCEARERDHIFIWYTKLCSPHHRHRPTVI